MKYLLIWLLTIIASKGIGFINKFKMFKDIGDNGYKLSINDYKENFIGEKKLFDNIISFIPVINIVNSMLDGIDYIRESGEIFNQLRVYGFLEEMDKEEMKQYANSPTGFMAYNISLRSEMLKKTSKLIISSDNSEDSIVYYIFDKKNRMKIYKITGPLSLKTKEEQDLIIKKTLNEIISGILDKVIEADEKIASENDDNESNNQKKIDELKRIRDLLLENSIHNNEEVEEEKEKIKKLIKK